VPQHEFEFNVPTVYCYQDFVSRVSRKLNRISWVLSKVGWLDDAGNLGADVAGNIPGGVGQAGHGVLSPIIEDYDNEDIDDLTGISLQILPSGYWSFQFTNTFANSFGVWCSPLFRYLTGFEELLVYSGNTFGEVAATAVAGGFSGTFQPVGNWNFLVATTTPLIDRFSTKSLQNTFDERGTLVLRSDLPIPLQQHVQNEVTQHRFMVAEFDIHELHRSKIEVNSTLTKFGGYGLSGGVGGGILSIVKPNEHGFVTMILPSVIPAFNFTVYLRRKVWDTTTNKYSTQLVNCHDNDSDTFQIKLLFSTQE
jgi:hypothetical protein